MGRRINKIKTHFRENKRVYLACGGTGVATMIGTLVITRRSEIGAGNIMKNGVFYKPTQTLDIHIEALGDPGNIIQDTTTGIVYASQNQAARELGLTPQRISEQLAGKVADVRGHTFAKLGKAHVAA